MFFGKIGGGGDFNVWFNEWVLKFVGVNKY